MDEVHIDAKYPSRKEEKVWNVNLKYRGIEENREIFMRISWYNLVRIFGTNEARNLTNDYE